MEYEFMMQTFANNTVFNQTYINAEQSKHMTDWLRETPNLSYQYATEMVMTMPSPRYKTYENSDYQVIQDNVLGQLDKILNGIGLYDFGVNTDLLYDMKGYSTSIMFIGLIFDILLLIFVVISCLLIYSLLLISVETKTFENGVMRLVGLTKKGYVAMIMT